jgi:hypothetical protein
MELSNLNRRQAQQCLVTSIDGSLTLVLPLSLLTRETSMPNNAQSDYRSVRDGICQKSADRWMRVAGCTCPRRGLLLCRSRSCRHSCRYLEQPLPAMAIRAYLKTALP